MRLRTALAMLLIVALPACAQTPATHPYEAVTYRHEARQKPPERIHIVTVDLTDPRVHLVVSRAGEDPDGPGPWSATLQTVRAIADRDELDVAVNGDFFISRNVMKVGALKVPYFVGNWARPCGWAMSDGVVWAATPAPVNLLVDRKGRVTIGRLGGPPPEGTQQVVSGMSLLVEHGKNIAGVDTAAPRTAVGIDAAGKRLFLHVVDGRRPEYSTGMTLVEQADELIKLGCETAMQLDGGGSSTLVIRDPKTHNTQVINRPSDGHQFAIPMSIERPVANVLGVKIDKPAKE